MRTGENDILDSAKSSFNRSAITSASEQSQSYPGSRIHEETSRCELLGFLCSSCGLSRLWEVSESSARLEEPRTLSALPSYSLGLGKEGNRQGTR